MSSESHNATTPIGGGTKALGIGVAGLAVCIGFGLRNSTAVMEAYLLAYLYWLALALGSLSLLLLQYISGGRWGLTIRRLLEAAAGTLPLLALLFVPIFLLRQKLYIWADPEVMAHDHVLQLKQAYLNGRFFAVRAVIYFATWIGFARAMTRWSRQLDAADSPAIEARLRRLAAPGLVVYALTVTFAAFDWGMSLEPHWFSTIYGVIYAVGGALGALALSIVTLRRVAARGPHATFLNDITIGDLGNLSLALTMFWTYVSLSQLLIIWSGHLPEETPWYFVRLNGGWQFVGIALLTMQFALPFLLLLSRDRKRDLNRLARVAIFILCMRFVDLFWQTQPAFSETFRVRGLEFVALAGVGGIWFWLYLRNLASAPLLPPRLAAKDGGGGHHG